jgi:membrane-associated protease RseP (regulator of RpoE activity)
MTNMTRSIPFVVALLALVAHDASAQQRVSPANRGWLGFSYETTMARVGGERRQVLEVAEVVSGSPAERAGLQVGDSVVTINDLRINDRFMESLSYSIAPGDNVRLRVRRDGRDRQLTVTAGERPADLVTEPRQPFYLEISPDSIRRRMSIYLDSARIALDSMHLPRLRVERLPGGGAWMYSDSARFRVFPDDSAWMRLRDKGIWMMPGDSLLKRDLTPFFGRAGGFTFRGDSLMSLKLDSLGVQLRAMPRGRIYGLSGDSLFTWTPGTAPSAGGLSGGISVFGMRAVGGAELTELNPGLGEYFGTDSGVLVVRVPDDTPADRAGLQAGDVIVKANGTAVASVSELRRAIGRAGQRSTIQIEILRKKVRRTLELRDD